jgi:hypothetical protein
MRELSDLGSHVELHGTAGDVERVGSCPGHRGEHALQIARSTSVEANDRHPQGPGGRLHRLEGHQRARRKDQDRHAGEFGHQFFEQRQPLPRNLRADILRQPGNVAAGARDVRDEPGPDGIANVNHDDRDRRGGLLCRDDMRVATRHDDVDLEPDQVLGELREPLQLPVGEAVLDYHVPSRDVAKIPQAVFEGLHEVRRLLARRAQQIPDPGNLPRRLGLGGERRDCEADSKNDREPHHAQ